MLITPSYYKTHPDDKITKTYVNEIENLSKKSFEKESQSWTGVNCSWSEYYT